MSVNIETFRAVIVPAKKDSTNPDLADAAGILTYYMESCQYKVERKNRLNFYQ